MCVQESLVLVMWHTARKLATRPSNGIQHGHFVELEDAFYTHRLFLRVDIRWLCMTPSDTAVSVVEAYRMGHGKRQCIYGGGSRWKKPF